MLDAHSPILGWDFLSPGKDHYPILRTDVPRLSKPEQAIVDRVLAEIFSHATQARDASLRSRIQQFADRESLILEPDQVRDIEKVIGILTHGAGPLEGLLRDSQIEEIAITGIGKSFPVRVYHIRRGWMETPLFFTQENILLALVNRLILSSGKRLSGSTPIVNAFLDEGSRLHASIFPISATPLECSIRKFIARVHSPRDLLTMKVLTPPALAHLELALRTDSTILIVGNTGSGKTTTLNALVNGFPLHERIVVVEETPELHLAHPHSVRLIPNSDAGHAIPSLIRETLRMRPDRVVIGEIRHPEEGRAFMESVLAGQGKGTLATFHGHSAREALSRLRQFGILESDLGWINFLVVQKRWSTAALSAPRAEIRAITEIVELVPQSDRVVLRPLFEWDSEAGILQEKNASILLEEKIPFYFPGKKAADLLRETQGDAPPKRSRAKP